MTDKQNITIKIADLPKIPLTINREDEELVRIAESNVNSLWADWCHRFKDKTSKEVLAMVAYQYAKLYYANTAIAQTVNETLEDFEKELDGILLNVE